MKKNCNRQLKSNNLFAIYKPKGPTSHDIINKLRQITGVKRIGHAGTLDPLASGILVIGVGREATKKLSEIVKKEKEYIADIKLGIESDTDDEEGEKKKITISYIPLLSDIKTALFKFEGIISQIPPTYSAVKVNGKEAYKLARRQHNINDNRNSREQACLLPTLKLKSRKISIKKIELLKYKWPNLKIKVITGPGAYIRSLARDLGRDLKVGGYLSNLERTRVGDFTKDNALII